MEFLRRAGGKPSRLGVLPGAFNPPTRAHLALATAALQVTDEVVFVLPRVFPHKPYEGACFEDRLRLLFAAAEGEPRYSIAASAGGLFIQIACECQQAYGEDTSLTFLCGSDAAERIVNWDYGELGEFTRMLETFELLVVSRKSDYRPPQQMRHRIHTLELEEELGHISATEVRRRMATGEPWEHLVPDSIVTLVRETYLL